MDSVLTDAPVGAVERFERLRRERRFGRSFERHREPVVEALPHPIVQLGLAAPAVERLAASRVGGRVGDDALVEANRPEEIAAAIPDLPEQGARLGQPRIELQRAFERARRVLVAPLQVGGDAGAEMQARVLRIGADGGAERVGGGSQVARVQRLPAGFLEQRRAGIDLPRRRGHQQRQNQQRSRERAHAIRLYS